MMNVSGGARGAPYADMASIPDDPVDEPTSSPSDARVAIAETEGDAYYAGDDGSRWTVDQAIDGAGFGRFQLVMLFFTGLAWMGDAMEMMLLSFLGPSVRCEWGVNPCPGGPPHLRRLRRHASSARPRGASSLTRAADASPSSAPPTHLPRRTPLRREPHLRLPSLRAKLHGFGLGGVPTAFSLFADGVPPIRRPRRRARRRHRGLLDARARRRGGSRVGNPPAPPGASCSSCPPSPSASCSARCTSSPRAPTTPPPRIRRDAADPTEGQNLRAASPRQRLRRRPRIICFSSRNAVSRVLQTTARTVRGGAARLTVPAALASVPTPTPPTAFDALVPIFAVAFSYYGVVLLTTEVHVDGDSRGRRANGGPRRRRLRGVQIARVPGSSEPLGDIFASPSPKASGSRRSARWRWTDRIGRRRSMGAALSLNRFVRAGAHRPPSSRGAEASAPGRRAFHHGRVHRVVRVRPRDAANRQARDGDGRRERFARVWEGYSPSLRGGNGGRTDTSRGWRHASRRWRRSHRAAFRLLVLLEAGVRLDETAGVPPRRCVSRREWRMDRDRRDRERVHRRSRGTLATAARRGFDDQRRMPRE